MDDILRFEITEPTEPLIFISLVTLESFPLPKFTYRSANLNRHEIGNRQTNRHTDKTA